MPIFLDATDYRCFVHLLGDGLEHFGIECWNYCVMPNHYHLTLQPSRPNLSEALRRLNGDYALWWNRRHGRVGHVFQGRPKDQIVQREGYLLALSRYVVMNPVRAELAQRPEEWPWSSYRATVGLTLAPAFLGVSSTLRLFGHADDAMLRARFAEYVTSQSGDEDTVDRIRSNEQVLGDRAFKASLNGSSD
jgi:REP element-mobilizing transposase RayT